MDAGTAQRANPGWIPEQRSVRTLDGCRNSAACEPWIDAGTRNLFTSKPDVKLEYFFFEKAFLHMCVAYQGNHIIFTA